MEIFASPNQYLYNLKTTSSSEARKLWKESIKKNWKYRCAYCDSENELTLDHVVPQSKGGSDQTKNLVCCCKSCNRDKAHTPWEEWYFSQYFFDEYRYNRILDWITPDNMPKSFYTYGDRRNNAT
jgi:hypothetical protein